MKNLAIVLVLVSIISCSKEKIIEEQQPCVKINQELSLQAKKDVITYEGSLSLTGDITFIRKTVIKGDLNLNGFKVNAATCLVINNRVNGPGEISGYGAVFSKWGYQNGVEFGDEVSVLDKECGDPYEPTLSVQYYELSCD